MQKNDTFFVVECRKILKKLQNLHRVGPPLSISMRVGHRTPEMQRHKWHGNTTTFHKPTIIVHRWSNIHYHPHLRDTIVTHTHHHHQGQQVIHPDRGRSNFQSHGHPGAIHKTMQIGYMCSSQNHGHVLVTIVYS